MTAAFDMRCPGVPSKSNSTAQLNRLRGRRGCPPPGGWWESVGASPTASPTPPHHPGWPILHRRAQHVRTPARGREVYARDLGRTYVRRPLRIGWYGEARATPSEASTFLASTTHGVEVALECPARPAADGQAGARAGRSPHPPVSTTRRPRSIRAQQHHSDAAALHQRPGRRQRVEIDCQNALQI